MDMFRRAGRGVVVLGVLLSLVPLGFGGLGWEGAGFGDGVGLQAVSDDACPFPDDLTLVLA